MGRCHYSSAHWEDIRVSLRKITQWERKSSLIISPEIIAGSQHAATSLLAVVTLWWIMRGTKKRSFSLKSNILSHPFYYPVKTAIDICKPISTSLLLGVFLISLISSGVLQHSKATTSWHEYNTGHISILPKFIGNLLQVWRECHMGSLEYYSLLGLAHCSGHLILLLLLCGDVEVNPGPYEEDYSSKIKTEFVDLMQKTTTCEESLTIVSGGVGVGKTHFIAMALELEAPSLQASHPRAEMLSLYTAKNIQITRKSVDDPKESANFQVLTDEIYTKMMIKSGLINTSLKEFTSKMNKVRPHTLSEVDKHLCTIMCAAAENVESLDGKILGRIIDIGGQPQFFELLPRFINRMSVGIVIINLSQDLTDYPIVYFYGEDGKPVGEGVPSNLTNEHFFRLFLLMVVSQSSGNKNVKVIIVGTHRDVEYMSNESRESKEGKLQEIIASFQCEKSIIYTDETHSRVIFAVNAKTPTDEDRAISRKIMDVIMDEEHAEYICIPLKYHNLELTLKQMTHSRKVAVSFMEVFKHVHSIYKNYKEMKNGLIYLNNTFRIFYFKEFPDLVFGKPQLLLNLMTDIVIRHTKLATISGNQAVSAIWKPFLEQAIINEFILQEINNVYDDILTPGLLLDVLEVLLIVFKVKPGEYLMPSLLTATPTLSLMSSHSISMLLYFPLGLTRFGIYCSTVCKLASSCDWKLSPECVVHRNSFQFIPNSCGTVTLHDSFDSFFHILVKVSPKLPVNVLSSMCIEVRDTILRVVNEVTMDLRYPPDQPVVAFLCNYQHNPAMAPHAAIYIEEGGYLLCSKDHMVITEVTNIQRLWLSAPVADSTASKATVVIAEELPYYSSESQKVLLAKHLPTQKYPSIDYKPYHDKIEFILSVASDSEYEAAITYIGRPGIEEGITKSDVATILEPNTVVVGKFAGTPVALVKTRGGSQIREDLERELKHFQNAKYILCIGTGYGFSKVKMDFGDVFISSKLTAVKNIANDYSEVRVEVNTIEICDILHSIFCSKSMNISDCNVSKVRTAKYFVDNVVSGVNSVELHDKMRKKLSSPPIGGDMDGKELVHLKNIEGFIVIKSVTDYIYGRRKDTWNFTGTMAALHYIKECLTPYINHKDSVDNYLSALKKADKESIIDVMVAKLVFIGPSMQGKTVTRKRLTKAMVNIKSNCPDKSNTGVSEQSTVIICKDTVRTAVLADNDDWEVINIEEECQFFLNTMDTRTAVSEGSLHSVPIISEEEVENGPVTKSQKLSEEKSRVQTGQPKQEGVRQKQEERAASTKTTELPASTEEWTQKSIHNALVRKQCYHSLKERVKGLSGRCLLYMQDTGGQPELMDCLPALTIGPALYLLFCKLDSSLDDHYKIGYRGPDGNTLPIQSHFTIKEMLLTILASIDSMSYLSTDVSTNHGERVKNRTGSVYVVGTHKDLVDNKAIDIFDSNLQELVRSTVFYEKSLVKYWNETDLPSESGHNITNLHHESSKVKKRLIYPLDNMDGVDKEIQSLRTSIQIRLNSLFGSKQIPSHWLVFGFCLRKLDKTIVTLKCCFKLGEHLEMSKKDTISALHILHYDLGICMHFSNVPKLKHIVITNTQSVYKDLTALIESAFKPDILQPADAEKFKNYGQFSIEMFRDLPNYIFNLGTLVRILEHLNIVAPVRSHQKESVSVHPHQEKSESVRPHQEESVFFMPCVLQNASDEDIEEYEKENPIPETLSPLFVRYKCGLVPFGVFSAMIACLLNRKSNKNGEHIDLEQENLKRNHVQFSYGQDRDILTFIRKPEFIRIHISRQHDCDEKSLPLHQVCLKIKLLVEETLRKVVTCMLHSLYATSKEQYQCLSDPYQFAFKSSSEHSKCEHLCVVSDKDTDLIYMNCIKKKDGCKKYIRMEAEHLVWFGKEILPPKSKDNPTLTGELNIEDDFFTVHEYLLDAKVKWFYIGMKLKVKVEDLYAIEATKTNMDDRLLEMIKIWLHKGTNKTWQTVITALETKAVGRPDVAEKIRESLI